MRVSTWVNQINHTACQAQLFYCQKLVGVTGLAYILQARNFAIDNQLPSEDFLADSHWLSSPPTSEVASQIYHLY